MDFPNSGETGTHKETKPGWGSESGVGNIDQQEFLRNTERHTAGKVADREVAAATEETFLGEVRLNRSAYKLVPGDTFALSSEKHKLNRKIVRATNIDYGSSDDERIRVNFVEDVFARTAPNFERLSQGGVPLNPRAFNVTAESGAALLDWTAPRDNGGSPILRYEYQRDFGAWQAASGAATQHRVTGLVNGTSYVFRVRAVNEAGPGVPSAVVRIGPSASAARVPGVPTDFSGQSIGTEIEIAWSAPASDGGATIIRYEYEIDASGRLGGDTGRGSVRSSDFESF